MRAASPVSFLIVAESGPARHDLREMLVQRGFRQIEEAEGPREALGKLQARSASLVFGDWEMAPIDGLAFLDEVRQIRSATPIRVVLLTATAAVRVRRRRGWRARTACWCAQSGSGTCARRSISHWRAASRGPIYAGPGRRSGRHRGATSTMSKGSCKCERTIAPSVLEGYACGNPDCWRTPVVKAEFEAFVAELVRKREQANRVPPPV